MGAQDLEYDVPNALYGRPLVSDWQDPGYLVPEPRCSSANWCTMAQWINYTQNREDAKSWWMEYFEQAKNTFMARFMGKEPFSRIYSAWIVLPVCCVYVTAKQNGDKELEKSARAWLRCFWSVASLSSAPVSSVSQWYEKGRRWHGYAQTMVGARSWEREKNENREPVGIPHHVDQWPFDWILYRIINGKDSDHNASPWGSWCEWEMEIITKLESMDEMWHGLTQTDRDNMKNVIVSPSISNAKKLFPYVKDYGFMDSFRILKFSTGTAFVLQKAQIISGATAPLYACVANHDNGILSWLPIDPGARPTAGWPGAVKFGKCDVDLKNRKLFAYREPKEDLDVLATGHNVYRKDKQTNVLDLPSGELIYDITLDKTGIRLTDSDIVSDNPSKPIDPNIHPDAGGKIVLLHTNDNIPQSVLNAFVRSPRSITDILTNLRQFGPIMWESVVKRLPTPSEGGSDSYRKAYHVITTLPPLFVLAGTYLVSGQESDRKAIKDVCDSVSAFLD